MLTVPLWGVSSQEYSLDEDNFQHSSKRVAAGLAN